MAPRRGLRTELSVTAASVMLMRQGAGGAATVTGARFIAAAGHHGSSGDVGKGREGGGSRCGKDEGCLGSVVAR